MAGVVQRRLAASQAHDLRTQRFGCSDVPHIEQRHLDAAQAAAGISVLANAEQQAVTHRKQVIRKARHLQLARLTRIGRVGQVQNIKRIGLAEGDHIAAVTGKTHRIHLLAGDPDGRRALGIGQLGHKLQTGVAAALTQQTQRCR